MLGQALKASWLIVLVIGIRMVAVAARDLRSHLHPNGTELAVAYSDILPSSMFMKALENVESLGKRLDEREGKGLGNTAFVPLPTDSCAFPHNIVNHLLASVPELKAVGDAFVGAEYWMQIRSPFDPLVLHFDTSGPFQVRETMGNVEPRYFSFIMNS